MHRKTAELLFLIKLQDRENVTVGIEGWACLFKPKKKRIWILKIEIEDMNKKRFASFYSSRHGKNRRHTCASGMGRTRTHDLAVTRQRVTKGDTRVLTER